MKKDISESSDKQPIKHVVIAVHGIRTFADWYGRLKRLLQLENPNIEVEKLHFGYFSFFMLIFPWFRKAAAERYADLLIERLKELDGQRVDIVAHSFGTYVVATAFDRLKRETPHDRNSPIIQNLILAGSVLMHSFSWRQFCPTFIRRVVNDCGTRDVALLFSMFCLVGLGYGGRRGFDGIENLQFFNRFFEFGHSGFFKKEGKPYDKFMADNWIPILIKDEVPEIEDPRHGSRRAWFIAWLETWADPLKMAVHTLLFIMLPLSGWWLYSAEREANLLAKANLDAVHAMATVNWDGSQALQRALSATEKFDSPDINQVLKASVDISAIPSATLTHASTSGIYLAAAHPKLPIFAVSFTIPGRTIVSIIDAPSGKEVASFSASQNEENGCHINSQLSSLHFSQQGTYIILESIAGVCIWSLDQRKVIYTDLARERIDMNADESVALLVDGIVSGTKRLDLLDVKNGKVLPIGKMPIRPFDDIRIFNTGWVRTNGQNLILTKFGKSDDWIVHTESSERFHNLFASRDGGVVIASTEQGEVVAVAPDTQKILWRKTMDRTLSNVDFSRDGSRIAFQFSNGSNAILRTKDGAEIASFPATGYAEGIAFVGTSANLVLTNNRHHDLKVWNIEKKSVWRKVPRDIYQSGSAISASGEYLIAGGQNKTAIIWKLLDGALNTTYSLKLGGELSDIAIDANGKRLIALDENGDVSFGDIQKAQLKSIQNASQRQSGVRQTVSLDRHGTLGVVETRTGVVKVIDMETQNVRWSAVFPSLFSHDYKKDGALGKDKVDLSLFFQEEGNTLPIRCPEESWYLNRSGQNHAQTNWQRVPRICTIHRAFEAIPTKVSATDFYRGWTRISPSGKYVLVSVLDMLMVLDSRDGHLITGLSLGYDSLSTDIFAFDLGDGFRFQRLKYLEFLEDDRIVALTESNVIFTWKYTDGTFKEENRGALPSTWDILQISPGTSAGYFYNSENGDVFQVDLKSLQASSIVRIPRIISVQVDEVSTDKKLAIIFSEKPELIQIGEGPVRVPYTMEIWRASNLKKLSDIKEEYPIHAVAFSHDGQYVAVGTSLGTIRVYDTNTGMEKARIQRNEGVRYLAFTNNDLYILSTTGPSQTYPATAGTDTIQFDMWKTSDLRRSGCKMIESEHRNGSCHA